MTAPQPTWAPRGWRRAVTQGRKAVGWTIILLVVSTASCYVPLAFAHYTFPDNDWVKLLITIAQPFLYLVGGLLAMDYRRR